MAENVGEENNMVTLLGCVHDCVHERALPFSISLQPLSTHISTAHLTKQISDDAPISSSALSLHSTTHTDEITMHNCMRTHARGHTHTLTYWSSPDCTESFTPLELENGSSSLSLYLSVLPLLQKKLDKWLKLLTVQHASIVLTDFQQVWMPCEYKCGLNMQLG